MFVSNYARTGQERGFQQSVDLKVLGPPEPSAAAATPVATCEALNGQPLCHLGVAGSSPLQPGLGGAVMPTLQSGVHLFNQIYTIQ